MVSSSLLEHDPYWPLTLSKMDTLLVPSGGLFLSWGAMLNPHHCSDHADDGLFHPLALGKVIAALTKLGLYIHEYGYETRFGPGYCSTEGRGEVYLVAFKDKKFAVGDSLYEPLQLEDDLGLTADELNDLLKKPILLI